MYICLAQQPLDDITINLQSRRYPQQKHEREAHKNRKPNNISWQRKGELTQPLESYNIHNCPSAIVPYIPEQDYNLKREIKVGIKMVNDGKALSESYQWIIENKLIISTRSSNGARWHWNQKWIFPIVTVLECILINW